MNARRKRFAPCLAAFAALAVAGCGGGGGGDGGNPLAPLSIVASGLDDGVVGSAYSQVVVATGGTGAKTYTLSGALPAGLSLAIDGAISGIPAGPAGSANFTVTATDSASPAATDSQDFTLTIADPLAADAGTVPTATVGVAYTHTISISGGTPPYTVLANLPAGLVVDAQGAISGTPAADARTSAGGANIEDSASPPQLASFDFHLPVELEVATVALPDAIGGVSYSAQLDAQGGLPEFTWEMTGGNLSLTVTSTGRITGTPPASCASTTSTLDVRVTDSDTPARTAERLGITLAVNPRAVSFLAANAPPVGSIGQDYTHPLLVSAGVAPFTFAVTAGTLPSQITLNPSSGVLSGTPDTGGTSNFTVEVSDDCATSDSRAMTIIVRNAPTGRNDSIATATPIGNGIIGASISPSGNPNTVFDADDDYYVVQTTSASTVTVDLSGSSGGIDTVVELLNAAGNRLQTCGPPQYTSECMNDDRQPGNLDSLLEVRVNAATTFYIHVVEWRGDGRPDLRYSLQLSGIN